MGGKRELSTSHLLVGGHAVTAINDDEFSKVRSYFEIDEEEFLSTVDFDKMDKGGGKGGMFMSFTDDKLYIVKELNGDDHGSLLKIAKDYAKHVTEGSLIARVFAHFKKGTKNFMVMNNWMPPVAAGSKNYSQYDLKGCADDKTLKRFGESVPAVHKRIFNLPMWFGTAFWSQERFTYFEGKMHAQHVHFKVSKSVHDEIISKVKKDVEFLQKYKLMDYSLVVSYHVLPRNDRKTLDTVYRNTSDKGAQPFVGHNKTQTYVVYLGIIDFLQDWTAAKVAANCIKIAERNKATIPPLPYGDRFAEFVKEKFVAELEEDHVE